MSTNDDDLGFTFTAHKNGSVEIFHHQKFATRFRGKQAARVLMQLESSSFTEEQQRMARLTGNYKRGNERPA